MRNFTPKEQEKYEQLLKDISEPTSKDSFWNFINSHWIFSNKEKYIDNKTAMMLHITKRNECNFENMYLDLLTLFEDYVENVNQK